jgi:type III secretion protein J
MADEQLPRQKPHGLLEAADHGQLVPSQAAEHAQLIAGLSGDLERTLGGIEGVLSARVHLNVPARDGIAADATRPVAKSTASVLVEHRGTTPPLTGESVQRLVAGGAPGLLPADVAVVFIPHVARPSNGRADFVHVGPIAVARGSSTTLKIALGSLLLVAVVLGAAALGLYTSRGRLKREQETERAAARAGASGARGAAVVSVHPAAPPPSRAPGAG